MTADVVVAGQLARDLVLVVDDVPEAGQSGPVRERREMLGGKGANQAVAVAQLGLRPALIAVAGDDEAGSRLRDRRVRGHHQGRHRDRAHHRHRRCGRALALPGRPAAVGPAQRERRPGGGTAPRRRALGQRAAPARATRSPRP
jgi:hypothetical protein